MKKNYLNVRKEKKKRPEATITRQKKKDLK